MYRRAWARSAGKATFWEPPARRRCLGLWFKEASHGKMTRKESSRERAAKDGDGVGVRRSKSDLFASGSRQKTMSLETPGPNRRKRGRGEQQVRK